MWRLENNFMRINSENNKAGSCPATDRTPDIFFRCLALAICAVLALVVAGCQTQPILFSDNPGNPFEPNPGAENYSTNELHEGDVVGITFQYSTNFDTVQKIALDGKLNLDMVGPVKASGRTLIQLQQSLTNLYSTLAAGDVITAKLLSSEASIYVSGAVLRPGWWRWTDRSRCWRR